jgi:hypothetical protein
MEAIHDEVAHRQHLGAKRVERLLKFVSDHGYPDAPVSDTPAGSVTRSSTAVAMGASAGAGPVGATVPGWSSGTRGPLERSSWIGVGARSPFPDLLAECDRVDPLAVGVGGTLDPRRLTPASELRAELAITEMTADSNKGILYELYVVFGTAPSHI